MKLRYEEVTRENLELAVKVQNSIFIEEDGRTNFLDAINKNNYRKLLLFWIVYDLDAPIGISGVYVYHEYPEDIWLGWYGVLESERGKGYGYQMLCDFEDYARKNGYKNIRLYTDELSNRKAINLYVKFGMESEKYENENEGRDMDTTLIFSKNLDGGEFVPWGNKFLDLTGQLGKEQEDK